ncbi:hypothetical protein FNF28_06129 [Cafeteria roenbergensis]|uniref:Uncharacterized protein n=1 Tax=Cafeteria roenbergensis TaxID=33653 RepID=A0A5A8D1Q1_CAFRO|nr:hypothetical protein FNF28_06129 [Cafeteria roenbergensis]
MFARAGYGALGRSGPALGRAVPSARLLASVPSHFSEEKVSRVRRLDSFKPKKARDVALHPGDDPSTMAMPSGARPEDKEIGKLTPRPYKGTDHDDLDPHVKESTSPRRYSREQAIAETRRTERIQNLPKGFRTWEEVSRADARRLHQVQKEQERNREQAILSKPLKVALPKPGRGARRSGSVLGSRPGERGAEERQGADGEDVMEAPRAVSDTKHRKSLRLSRVAAQLRRELANVLSQRRIREPGLYPLGLPLHVVEVEVSPDLRVARVRWQLPVVHAPRTRAATLRGGQTASQRASTAAVLGTAEPSAVEQLAAREWSRRVADTLSRGADKEGAHPGRLAREAQRREKDRAARRARMQAAGRMARQAGLDVEDGDSDLDLLDDEGGAGTALPEALRRRMEAASPDAAFGVDSAGPGGALAAFLGAGARAQGAPVPLEKTASGAEEGSLAWRLDQSVLRSQLAQWRSSVRAGTRKPTVARVMGWAERAAVPSDPVLRAAFKEAKSALDRRAPELRRQVGARVPLRILPRLEFHPWLGSAPNELLNAARQGMTSAARAPLAAAAADGERA